MSIYVSGVQADPRGNQDDMKTNDRITVRLPAELRERLKAAARRRGTRESDLVRKAVERQLAAGEKPVTACDLAKKAGIIGIVKDGPRDLSTNKKYFEGLGES